MNEMFWLSLIAGICLFMVANFWDSWSKKKILDQRVELLVAQKLTQMSRRADKKNQLKTGVETSFERLSEKLIMENEQLKAEISQLKNQT